MRIVCPNCASQYEVDDSAIPETGRDVQCAKCSEIWFQDPPMLLSPVEQPLSLETPTNPAPESAPQPEAAPTEQSVSDLYENLQQKQASEDSASTESPSDPSNNGMELPEVVEQAETTPAEVNNTNDAQAAPAMFRSLRASRGASEPIEQNPEPAPTPEATAPVANNAPQAETATQEEDSVFARPKVSDAVKSILQEEADYSSQAREQQEAKNTNNIFGQTPTQQQASGTSAPTLPAAEQSEFIQEVRPVAQNTGPSGEVTIASARNLRDVLASQDPADQSAERQPEVAQASTAAPEKSLSDLGFKRPSGENDLNSALDKTPSSATGDTQPQLAATSSKSGKSVFTDIDEINSNIEIDSETDSKMDGPDLAQDIAKDGSNAFKTGFYTACALALITLAMYIWGPIVADAIPATDGFVSAFRDNIDSGRMVLQNMYYGGEGEPGFSNLVNNLKAVL